MNSLRLRLPLLLTFGLIFTVQVSLAQVNKVKDKASQHSSNSSGRSSSSSSYDYSSDGDGYSSDGCLAALEIGCEIISSDACASLFTGCGSAIGGFFTGWASYQAQIVARKDTIPYVSGLEVEALGSYDLASGFGTYYYAPQARLTYGMFSTAYRFSYHKDETGYIQSHDWQILQLNLAFSKNVRLYIGSGLSSIFMPDIESGLDFEEVFAEHSIGTDIYFAQNRIQLRGEYRWVSDYEFGYDQRSNIRKDFSINAAYRFFSSRHTDLQFVTGYRYQAYFDDGDPVEFKMVTAGIRCYVF